MIKYDFTNSYVRLQTYYTYLTNSPDLGKITITLIHEITSIPLPTIRSDFYTLYCWFNKKQPDPNYAINIDIDDSDEIEDEDELYVGDNLKNALIAGKLDKAFLSFDDDTDNYLFTLTFEQVRALGNYRDQNSMINSFYINSKDKFDHKYQIKDNYQYHYNYENLLENLTTIHTAIEEDTSVTITFRNRQGKNNTFTIKPLKISYDSDENQYSLISYYQDQFVVYRLDSILFIEESDEDIKLKNIDFDSFSKKVWGNNYNDEPVHVKVKFYNEANVWDKVRKDLYYRDGNLYEKNSYLYYEDTVYGINKFRSWIFSYGSSAIVLEPVSLRQQIIDSLKSRI